MSTLKELSKKPTIEGLKEILRESCKEGGTIDAKQVIGALHRLSESLTIEDKKELINYAIAGIAKGKSSWPEYREIHSHLHQLKAK